ncbi:MAG TPA: tetratricopeptide repeat protein [Pyrinomonadaceae bacterium]|jgi:TolB-like protein/DNA-binding winged helix-turn-helix (wHTH) protein
MLSRKLIWYDFDDFRLDAERQRLLKDGVPVTLSPKAFQTLLILVERAGETIEKDEIYNQLWADSFVEEGNLTQYIYLLRKSLGQSYIETVARHGYRFTAQVKTVHAEISIENQVAAEKTEPAEQSKFVSAGEDFALEKAEEPDEDFPHYIFLSSRAKPAGEDKQFDKAAYPHHAGNPKLQSRKLIPLVLLLLFAAAAATGFYIYFADFRSKSIDGTGDRKIKSIAILPFRTIGGENADEPLGLGMTDAVITRLSKLKQIPVRPTSAVFRFVGAETTAENAGRDLQVEAILEGTVQRGGDWVRVSVRLIKVENGETIWAENFDEKYTHIFTVLDKISTKVVDSLALNLSPNQEQNAKKRATDNIEAYQAYTLGIYFWSKRTREGLQKAEQYFSRAIELDPNYAQAYAGLADTYNMLVYNRFVPLAEVGEKARQAALKAVELDDTVAEGHMALAQVQFVYEKNNEAGLKSLERAVELSPYNATARVRYGWRMVAGHRLEDAEREMRLGQEYDPLSPTYNLALCNILVFARKYDEAVKFCEQALEIDRDVPGGRVSLAEAYLFSGKNERALALALEETQANPNDLYSQSLSAYVQARAGNPNKAIEIADRLRNEVERMPVLYADLALTNYVAGRHDQAFELLQKGLEKKAVSRINLVYDPKFDEIKRDSRFTDLIQQYGLLLNPPS